jgi:mRNA interferase RelE/StbE
LHEVYLEHAAEKDLKKLPGEIFQRLIIHIKSLAETPRPSGCRKITGTKNDWRIRVGDFRIIYEIDDKAHTVKVMCISITVRHIADKLR